MTERLRDLLAGFRPRPVAAWELLVMRCLFALVVWKSMPWLGKDWLPLGREFIYAEAEAPNGIARWIDLTFIANEGVYPAMLVVLAAALLLYVSGFLLPLALPVMFAVHVMARTLFNSQGWVHHGVQMVSLVILAQLVVVLGFTVAKWVKKRPPALRPGLSLGSYFLFYSQMAVVSIYVVSVVSKVDRSDGKWFAKSHYVGLHVVKAERDRYHNALEPPAPGEGQGAWPEQVARGALAHPNWTRLFLGLGVALEGLAFLALLGRRWAAGIALGLIGFHASIAKVMDIHFDFNVMLLVIFLINIPYWAVRAVRHLGATGDPEVAPA